jgi:predicted transport protein
MTAIKLDGGVGLKFTRVVDEITRGPNDVDDGGAEVVGRDYWVKRSSEQVLQLADQVLAVVKEFDPTLSLKYNKHYIGIAKDGVARNFIWLGPARSHLRLNISLPKDDTIIAELDKSGLNLMGYKWGAYRIRLSQSDDVGHSELIKTLLKKSYESF